MRLFRSILFNPSLFDFLVILAILNLGANVLNWLGLADMDLAHASEVIAIGFIIAVIYTAIWERAVAQP